MTKRVKDDRGRGFPFAVVSAVVLITVILLTTIQLCVFDLDFFQSQYQQNRTAETIGISERELMLTTEGLLSYIQGGRDDLGMEAVIRDEQRQVFNQREIDHMVDVKQLYVNSIRVRNGGVVVLVLLLLALARLSPRRSLSVWAKGYLVGTVVFIVVFGVLGVIISRDFFWFWEQFHLLFFSNDLWQLDPATDILIQIVPEEFFFDLVVRILVMFSMGVGVLALLAGGILLLGQRLAHKIETE